MGRSRHRYNNKRVRSNMRSLNHKRTPVKNVSSSVVINSNNNLRPTKRQSSDRRDKITRILRNSSNLKQQKSQNLADKDISCGHMTLRADENDEFERENKGLIMLSHNKSGLVVSNSNKFINVSSSQKNLQNSFRDCENAHHRIVNNSSFYNF